MRTLQPVKLNNLSNITQQVHSRSEVWPQVACLASLLYHSTVLPRHGFWSQVWLSTVSSTGTLFFMCQGLELTTGFGDYKEELLTMGGRKKPSFKWKGKMDLVSVQGATEANSPRIRGSRGNLRPGKIVGGGVGGRTKRTVQNGWPAFEGICDFFNMMDPLFREKHIHKTICI